MRNIDPPPSSAAEILRLGLPSSRRRNPQRRERSGGDDSGASPEPRRYPHFRDRILYLAVLGVQSMKAKIRAKIEAAKAKPVKVNGKRNRCQCADYVHCKTCRERRRAFIKKRASIGLKSTPLPPPPSRNKCNCGKCKLCLHRDYMKLWRSGKLMAIRRVLPSSQRKVNA